uniref:Iron-sulfur cluster formation ABC transporter ATP-binding subunit n=1 Tax=Eustigmatophyceae sp. Mont 10/10-1w TaxID=2506145 RepID=A0A451FMU7_9STRA|nr:iron-sulfur cluster formation ABC transporter ATP-binding subunit [Eustigmatophyceae sp. Mont 10/10-1w]QAA11742.1 iron-sulfur cluster formation ABC transporter ATP-binding subunit [Eustigmatophyceae sp. Mont 10/10-1w]
MKSNENILAIKNLKATTETFEKKKGSKIILQGVNLNVAPGEIHIIMGPNGSGKSTLSKILSGHPAYNFLHGSVQFRQTKLIDCLSETRSRMGIFLGFQYPIEIAGVTNQDFLWLAYQSRYLKKSSSALNNIRFANLIINYTNLLKMKQSFLPRPLNQGFSGGEKKKNEVLQLCLLGSELGVLDEIDSGLDVDALKTLTKTILAQHIENSLINIYLLQTKSLIFITHYRRLLDYVSPDHVQVMKDGRIICHGFYELAKTLDRKGYDWLSDIGPSLAIENKINRFKHKICR